jgi:adenylosuccinate lyase
MAIHPIDYRYGSEEMRRIFEEEARLQRFLDVEAALARAHATVGSISKAGAEEITRKASTEYVKLSRVKEIEAAIKHDLMAVVEALAEACGGAGRHVHLGATSYDIVDTANALQFKAALRIIKGDLYEVEGVLLTLAEKHKGLVAVGRTHGQHATPITYGLKFALWAREVRRHLRRLEEAEKRVLVGKMSGAVGTQASFGNKGMDIQELVMRDLGLKAAMVSSQVVQRDRYAELLMLLALIAASCDKIAKEIRNLMRTEIGEVSEPFGEEQVGSSTMPHKRNPIESEKVCGLARAVKSNVFVALENVSLEHERDLTNSSCERVIIPESFILLDEILKTLKTVLKGLVLYPKRIKENLELTKGLNMAEAAMLALAAEGMPRQEAHRLIRKLSAEAYTKKKELSAVLKDSKEISKLLDMETIEEILAPEKYIGTAVEQVEKVLGIAREERK